MNDPKIYITCFVATHIPTGQYAVYHPMEEVRRVVGFAMAKRLLLSRMYAPETPPAEFTYDVPDTDMYPWDVAIYRRCEAATPPLDTSATTG